MRLINISQHGSFRPSPRQTTDGLPPYAILSHTWENGEEVDFDELVGWKSLQKNGWHKIRFCRSQALKDGLQNFWIDTCCIKKADPDEKHDAFDSMFTWYANSAVCYVFLSDVYSIEDLPDARWWKRGWTLQELLAPLKVVFFNAFGDYLGDKSTLEQEIHNITGIQLEALRGYPLSMFTFNERWAWMRGRITTFEEDYAYCTQGIFGVGIPRRYGERLRQAANRLREAEGQMQLGLRRKLEEAVFGNLAAIETSTSLDPLRVASDTCGIDTTTREKLNVAVESVFILFTKNGSISSKYDCTSTGNCEPCGQEDVEANESQGESHWSSGGPGEYPELAIHGSKSESEKKSEKAPSGEHQSTIDPELSMLEILTGTRPQLTSGTRAATSTKQADEPNGFENEVTAEDSTSTTTSSLGSESESLFHQGDDTSCTSFSLESENEEASIKESRSDCSSSSGATERIEDSDYESDGSWTPPRYHNRTQKNRGSDVDDREEFGGYPRRMDIVDWINREVHRL